MVQDQSWQKRWQDPISTNEKLGMVVHTCHPSYEGSANRIMAQAGPGWLRHKASQYLKTT
jgi:hypothetical protein